MKKEEITERDQRMAKVCGHCFLCRHARKNQKGAAYRFVRTIEEGLCPFCKAYEKVYDCKAHEPKMD